MLIFGHAGITLGAALLLNGVLVKSHVLPTRVNESRGQPQRLPRALASQNTPSDGIGSWFASLADRVDIRLLLIGSLLPDIIDKPLYFLFPTTLGTSRTFCHTLLFLILITFGGLCLYCSHKKTWLLVLSFGTFTHLILDGLWLHPRTLLWPLYGLSFERTCPVTLIQWIQDMLNFLLSHPVIIIPELVGAIIIIWFVSLLVYRRTFYTFIRDGQV